MPFYKDWVALLILVVTLSLTFFTADYLRQRDIGVALVNLEADVETYAAHITTETERSLTLMSTLKSFLGTSQVGRETFYAIAEDALQRYDQLQGIAWVPYVSHQRREAAEASQRENMPGFEFKERRDGHLVRAAERAFYLPVYYQQSKNKDRFAVGLDMAVGAFAEDIAELIATADQHSEEEYLADMLPSFDEKIEGTDELVHYLTVAMPVYKHSAERSRELQGFLIGAIKMQSLQQNFPANPYQQHIDLVVADVTRDDRVIYLIVTEGAGASPPLEAYEFELERDAVGGRHWQFTAMPTERYMELLSSDQWYIVTLLGVVMSILGAAYAHGLLSRTLTIERVVAEKTELLKLANHKLEALSRTDGLTQLANRRYFDEYLETEWYRARREKRPLSLLLIDVDYFKNYNDHYGHVEGDSCLQQVALSLRSCFTRSGDLIARYGGEEFAAVLPSTELACEALIERCRQVVLDQQIPHERSEVAEYVTISLGGCTVVPSDNLAVSDIVKAADQALYRAKTEGRNRGVVFDFQRTRAKQGVNVSL